MEELLLGALRAARAGAREILAVYGTDFGVERKSDLSPITEADRRSQAAIREALSNVEPGLPFLGEEGAEIPYAQRRAWRRFWLVDPLDGTKEFVSRNGEFTVNIALIEEGRPVLGLVYAPLLSLAYLGIPASRTALRVDARLLPDDGGWEALTAAAAPLPAARTAVFTVAASRSHMNAATQAYIEECRRRFGEVAVRTSGSSLKICHVAEGLADINPRIGPTYEWDVASGQAVLEATGGEVRLAGTTEPLTYNKPNLLNPPYVCVSRPYLDTAPLG